MSVNIHAYMEVIRIRVIQDDNTGREGNTGILDMLLCTEPFFFAFPCPSLVKLFGTCRQMPG